MLELMVDTEVGRLSVRVKGEGNLPVAVLWHSLFVDDRTWDRTTADLARLRQLLLITGPGHGGSGDPGHRYTLEDCVDAAVTVLRTCAVNDPVDWVGNAWGGHVGIMLAAARPDLVRTLVTAGTPAHTYPMSGRLKTGLLLGLYRVLGATGLITKAVTDALLSASTRTTDPAATALVAEGFRGADRSRMANAIVSVSLRRPDLTPLLPKVQAPALFITGSEHPDWRPEQARAAIALLPHGGMAIADGAAYLPPLETPAAFVRLVSEFWSTNPPAAGGSVDNAS